MTIPPLVWAPEQHRKKKRRHSFLRFLGVLFAGGVILFLVGSAGVGYLLWSMSKELPDYEVLAQYEPPVMTRIHASDGRLIAEYAAERRIYVPIDAIPATVIQAFLSAEDKNFYKHGGLDFQGIVRAVIINFNNMGKNKRLVGASTITQQVAKNFLLTGDQKYERKLKEAILAIRIDRAFTKGHILELYLNQIYFGLHAYGIAAAALNYYNKSLEELTISEAAYLAALPKGPNNYHPFKRRKRAIRRRNWVIDEMFENNYITKEEADHAKSTPLQVNPRPLGAHILAADFFAEEVRRELMARFGKDKVLGGGLSVRTTLNPEFQRMARKALVDGLVAYDRRHGWRGAIDNIDVEDNWGEDLNTIEILSDIAPWRLAVVLKTSRSQAVIGLRPRKTKSGQLEEARVRGVIPLKEMVWARVKKGKWLGKKPKTVTSVLSPGDVIYVAPVEASQKAKTTAKKNGEKAAEDEIKIWRLMQVPEVGGGIVVMDPHTGRIHALVGGFSFAESQFDRAVQAQRQPGSAFKPFVYAAAIDNGYTPASVIVDGPIEIEQGVGLPLWRPKNYGDKFYGPSTLRLGIEKSRNLMTVRLAQDVGMPMIAEYANRFGIYDNLLPVLAMSLGAGETSLLRLTTGYAMIANGGKQIRATLIDRIQDRYGRTVWRHDRRQCEDCAGAEWQDQNVPELLDVRKQIIDPHTSYQIISMLQGVVQRGTGVRVKVINKPVAGKTGTTNEEKDAWFIGFTPDMVVGVFVGFDNPSPMGKGETGSGVASPVFRDFMEMALAGKPALPFRIPPGIQLIRINAKSGLRARRGDKDIIHEAFKPGERPPDTDSNIGVTPGNNLFFRPPNFRDFDSNFEGLY